jgi:transporter family-2 protein
MSWGIAALATAGVITRPFKWPEAVWAVAGALLLVVLGLLPITQALQAVSKGADVYLFLFGMMVLSEVGRREGLFDWVAVLAVNHAKGSPKRLFLLVYLVGVVWLLPFSPTMQLPSCSRQPSLPQRRRPAQSRCRYSLSVHSSRMRQASFSRYRTPRILFFTATILPRWVRGWRALSCRRCCRSSQPTSCCAGRSDATCRERNGVLRASLVNPWLASAVSFMLVTFLAVALFCVQPHPLPTLNDLKEMRWWAPLGGMVGAVAVFAGLTLVQKVGVGTLNGLTICANLLASIAIDHFALVDVPAHPLS